MKRLSRGRSEALAAFHEISALIVSSLDLDETLLTIARAATHVLEADIGAIFLPDDEPGLIARGVFGARSEGWEGLRLDADRGLNVDALRSGRVSRIDDYLPIAEADPRAFLAARDPGGAHPFGDGGPGQAAGQPGRHHRRLPADRRALRRGGRVPAQPALPAGRDRARQRPRLRRAGDRPQPAPGPRRDDRRDLAPVLLRGGRPAGRRGGGPAAAEDRVPGRRRPARPPRPARLRRRHRRLGGDAAGNRPRPCRDEAREAGARGGHTDRVAGLLHGEHAGHVDDHGARRSTPPA